jgi:cytoskeletal protein RodZ
MTLGTLIAQARKSAGLSIEDLAAKTNIRITVLREIEMDNFVNCGGETYARGHVRNIASALDIDASEFINLYEQEQGGETKSMRELLVENNVMRQPEEGKKVSWKVLVTISMCSLAIVGVAQVIISNSPSTQNSRTSQAYTTTTKTSATPSPTSTVSKSPSPTNTFSTGTGVEVQVSATRGKSWLFVSDAQGHTLFSGQLSQGDTKVFTTDTQLALKVGNAGGIDLTVNGKKVAPIGGAGEVVSVSYGVNS